MKTQIGKSITGNLHESTWTFEVENLELRSGQFAIVPIDKYEDEKTDLSDAILSIKDFRNFIRTERLTEKWESYLKNKQ